VLAGVDCDNAVVASLRHDERLQSGASVYLQAACLYTTPTGARRVRVHTLALPVAGSIGAIFRGADLEATVQALYAQHVTVGLAGGTVQGVRNALEARCVAILTAYRRHCAVRSSGEGQLILPESLKLLPLYTTMLFKSPALAARADPDARAADVYARSCASPRRFAQAALPRLIDVGAARHIDGFGWAPAALLPCASESISAGGVYLIENAVEARFPSVLHAVSEGCIACCGCVHCQQRCASLGAQRLAWMQRPENGTELCRSELREARLFQMT
jgi:protein transport protein SEC24